MFTDSLRDEALGLLPAFVGLIETITDLRAGTVTETNYTGYGTRPGITWGAAANTSPVGGRQRANSGLVSFPQNTGADDAAIAYGLYTAATAGTLKAIGFLDADPPVVGTAEGTAEDITAPAHGLATDQRVFVLASPGALLPAGLSENVAYFVLAAGLTTDTFRLSTTSGGAAVNITARGAAMFIPYTSQTIAAGATPELAIGAVVIQL